MRELIYVLVTLVLVGLWLGSASIFTGIAFWGFTVVLVVVQLTILVYAVRDVRRRNEN
ncbi:hypothetical protein [Haladaptatus cibarius]|uniref:hypothetical protein n=1 Tax=Haladaptatus cibarius TaxID=453847 RepID=UPI000B152E31|nr:hypothetical protein [Haladaptatus cibarius]